MKLGDMDEWFADIICTGTSIALSYLCSIIVLFVLANTNVLVLVIVSSITCKINNYGNKILPIWEGQDTSG